MPESPKWLLINGRKEEAIEALNRMAKLNGSEVRFSTTDHFQEETLKQQNDDNF